MKNCLFCDIANRRTPGNIRLETKKVAAFDDINPKAPVHILIVPKKHLADCLDIKLEDKELLVELILAAQKLARQTGIDQTGFRLVVNNKKHAGQIIDHLHIHLLGGKQLGG